MKVLYKAAEGRLPESMTFVMASDSKDRHGDINVATSLKLDAFNANPVVLLSHNHSEMPVGIWENLRKAGGKLLGELKLAAPGTSRSADLARSLIEQKILRGVSVGFRVIKAEDIDDKSYARNFIETELLEASLVAVPANPQAIMVAKSLGATSADLKNLFSDLPDGEGEQDPAAVHQSMQAAKLRSAKAIIAATRLTKRKPS